MASSYGVSETGIGRIGAKLSEAYFDNSVAERRE
jgi:hypothetical protein